MEAGPSVARTPLPFQGPQGAIDDTSTVSCFNLGTAYRVLPIRLRFVSKFHFRQSEGLKKVWPFWFSEATQSEASGLNVHIRFHLGSLLH